MESRHHQERVIVLRVLKKLLNNVEDSREVQAGVFLFAKLLAIQFADSCNEESLVILPHAFEHCGGVSVLRYISGKEGCEQLVN